MPPRPKKEYEERESDETGTPFQRFERALEKVISTPKKDVEKRVLANGSSDLLEE